MGSWRCYRPVQRQARPLWKPCPLRRGFFMRVLRATRNQLLGWVLSRRACPLLSTLVGKPDCASRWTKLSPASLTGGAFSVAGCAKMQRACRSLSEAVVGTTFLGGSWPASPPSLRRMPRRHSLGLASVGTDCRLCALFGCSGRRRAWSTRHGPPSSFQSDVRAPARASKTFGGLCLFSIHHPL